MERSAATKNIVICCDGTGNQFGETNSNVVKLYACLAVSAEQVAYYHPGLGTIGSPNQSTRVGRWVTKVTGLAFGLSHFHHSMKNHVFPIKGVPGVTQREVNHAPFDLPAAHIFKISDGKIHQIEAMGFLAPYNSPSGW